MDKREIVAFAKFIKELKNKYVYHKTGGKSFRQLISLIAFIVAVESEIKRAEYFLDRKNVKHVVQDVMPTLDEEKREAVIIALFTVAKDLHLKSDLPAEIKE